jgi:hypothetical protein
MLLLHVKLIVFKLRYNNLRNLVFVFKLLAKLNSESSLQAKIILKFLKDFLCDVGKSSKINVCIISSTKAKRAWTCDLR